MYSILYVDDEPGLLEIAKIFLEQTGGFSVDTDTSARHALPTLKTKSYDAIISDYQMPGMDGIAFLKEVRAQYGDLPFILFTGRGREEIVIEAINNGVDFYLQKGGDPASQFAELAHKVRQAVVRQQAELLRTESEKRLADIINFLPDATFAIDRSGHVIAWNRAIEEMTGVPASEMVGKGDFEYAVPFYGARRKILIDLIFEPNDVIAKFYSHIFHEKDILIAETTLSRPKGRVVTLMGKASPLYDRRGEIVGAIESIRDITERKRAEEDLLAAKKDWETIFRAVGHPAFVLDTKNRILDANDATLTATGLSIDEIRGKYCFEIFHKPGTNCPPGPCPCEKLKKTGQSETVEMEVEWLNGYFLITCTPVFDAEGNFEKVIHIAMDITSRRRAEEKLRVAHEQLTASEVVLRGQYEELAQSEQRVRVSEMKYRELAELLPQIVFEMDRNFTITFVNRQAYAALGYSPDEVASGFNALSIIDPSQSGRVEENIRKQIAGEPFEHIEYTLCRKDGSTFPGLIYADPVFQGGDLTGFRGIIIDIADRKKMEEALRESEDRLSSIFAAAQVGIIVIDAATHQILQANAKALDLIGATEPDVVGKICHAVICPAEEGRCPVTDYQQEIESSERELLTSDGRKIPVIKTVVRSRIGGRDVLIESFIDITERKRAEDELRIFMESVENSSDAVGISTPEGKHYYQNRAFDELFGPVGENPPESVFVDPAIGHEVFRTIMAGGQWTGEVQMYARDKRILDVLLRAYASKDKSGRITSLVGIHTDITERKRAEEALRESEANLLAIMDNTSDIIASYDREIRLVAFNRACSDVYRALFGIELRQGLRTIDLFPEGQRGFWEANNARALSGESFQVEFDEQTPAGETRLYESSFNPIRQGLEVVGFSTLTHDITDRKRAEDELRSAYEQITASEEHLKEQYEELAQSEQRLRTSEEELQRTSTMLESLLNSIPDVIGVQDTAHGMIRYNAAGYAMLGQTPEGVRGKKCFELIGHDAPCDICATSETYRTKRPAKVEKFVPELGIWLDVRSYPILDSSGEIRYVIEHLRDITEQKNAEEEIRKKNDELSAANERLTASQEELQQQYGELAAMQDLLQKSQQQLDEMAGTVPGVIYQFYARPDGKMGLYYVSKRAPEVFGISSTADDFFERFTEHVDARDRDALLRSVSDVIKTGLPWHFEGRFVKPSGEEIWFEGISHPVRHGEELVYSGILSDITGRRRAEAELRAAYDQITASEEQLRQQYGELAAGRAALEKSEKNFRTLVEQAPDAIYFQTNTRFRYLNAAAVKLLGASSADELIGTSMWDRIHPSFHERIRARVQTLTVDREPVELLDEVYVRMDGSLIDVEVKAVPLEIDGEHGVLVLLHDISARKLAENKLRTAYEQLTASEEELRNQYEQLALSEQRIRESEQKYRELAELLPQIVFEMDRNFTITFVNRQAYAALGYSEQDVAHGFNALSIIDPSQHERVRENFRKLVANEPFEHLEYTIRRKDGSTFPGLIYADPVRTGGDLTGFRGIIIDITDRKMMEDALRKSEEKYRTVFETTGAATVLLENDGTVSLANTEFEYLSGYKNEEVVGKKKWMDFVVREDLDRMLAQHQLRRTQPGAALKHYEFRFVRRSGELRDIYLTVALFQGTTKSVASLLDITERKRAEDALFNSQEMLKSVLDSIPQRVFWKDRNSVYLGCNMPLAKDTGYNDPAELVGKDDYATTSKATADLYRADDRYVMETGVSKINYEEPQVREDGSQAWLRTTKVPLRNKDGEIIGVLGTYEDITQRKNAEDLLRQQEATISSIFRAAPTGIGMVINRVIMKVNDRLCAMTGYPADELVGKSARILYPSDEDYEYVGREKYDQIRKYGTGTVETRWQRKDRTFIDVLLSSTPIDPADHGKGVTFTALDITGQKRQERIQKAQLDLGLSLQKIHGLTGTLDACLASAIWVSDMDAGAIYLADQATGSFDLAVAQNLSSDFIRSVSHYPADSVNVRIVSAGKPVYVPFGKSGIVHTGDQEREGLRAAAFIPITSGGRVVASLNVASHVLDEMPEPARIAIETIAIQIGAALERIKSEEALRESEERLHLALEGGELGTWNWNIQTGEVIFNQRWADMLGYRLDEIEPHVRSWENLVHPEDMPRVQEILTAHLEGRTENYECEHRLLHKDGSWVWVLDKGMVTNRDANGKPLRASGTHLDITGRRQTEDNLRKAYEQITATEEELRSKFNELTETQDDLRRQQQQLAEVANMVPGVMYQFYARPDGTRGSYYVSSRASEVFGFPEDAGDFYTWFIAHIDPHDRDAFLSSNDEVIAAGLPWEFQGRFIRPSGELIWFQGTSRPVRHGNELVFNGILQDITSQKQAELAIRENEQKYRTLVETTGTGFLIVDAQGNVLDANPEYVRLTGHTSLAEIAGRNVLEWTVESDKEKNAQAVQQCVRDGFIRNFEVDYLSPAGTITPIEINGTVLESAEGVRILTLCRDISERKKTQDALRVSEEKFRTVVETAQEGIWIIDKDFLCRFTNQRMQEIFGYTAEEMIGRAVWDFVPPDDVESMKEELSKRTRGIPGRYERRWRRKDGTIVWCLTAATPHFTPEGVFTGSFGVFTDITARKEMEEALRESEAKFRAVIDQSFQFIGLMNTDGTLIEINRSALAFAGVPESAVINRPFWDTPWWSHSKELQERLKDAIRRAASGETVRFEATHPAADGHLAYIDFSVKPVMDPSGAVLYLIPEGRDITQRKKAEEAVRLSEEKYRTLIENVQDVIYRTDTDGNLTMASPSFSSLLGYDSLDECIGKNIADAFWMEPARRRDFIDAMSENGSISGYEIVLKKRDGTPVIVSASSHYYYDADGSIAGVEGIFRDITGRKQAEEALSERERDYRGVIDNLQDVFYREDAAGNITMVSQSVVDVFGYSSIDDVIGLNLVSDFYENPEDRTRFLAAISQTGSVRNFETVLKKKDGSPIIVSTSAHYYRDKDGTVLGVEGIAKDITEWKHAQKALIDSEEKYRSLFENNHAVLLLVDPESGSIADANPAACTYYGWSRDELTRMNISDINTLTPDQIREEMILARDQMRSNFIFRHRRADGSIRDVEVYSGPIRMQGKVFLYSLVFDITERRTAETALKESEARLQSVLHGSPILQFVIDSNHRVIGWNRAIEDYSGIAAADILGTDDQWRAFYPEKRPVLADLLVDNNTDGLFKWYAGKIQKSRYVDGAYEATDFFPHMGTTGKWLAFTAAPIRDADGAIIGAVETLEDVTERINAEHALRESEQKYRGVIENIQDAYIRGDINGLIRMASPSLARLLGYDSVDEMIGMPIVSFYVEPDKRRELLERLAAEREFHDQEIAFRRRDGSVVLTSVNAHYVYNERGDIEGTEAIVRDITERKGMENAIREANKKLNLLNSITRHDVVNQLTVLRGYTKIAATKESDPIIADLLSKIDANARTISRQIEFTKTYQELGVRTPNWFRLDEVIERTKRKEVVLSNTCNHAEIFADPLLERVFFNLFDNAIRHGEHVTEISVRCERAPDGLVIIVEDDGAGIPPEAKEKIFDKGYGKHTGFGLFLAREILAITGITIRETGYSGVGARFEIAVPKSGSRFQTGSVPQDQA